MGQGLQRDQVDAMTWALIDDSMDFHRKVVEAGNGAFGAWVRMLCWTRREGTDGRLPANIVRSIATKTELKILVSVRLLDEVSSGYEIHDFVDHNLTSAALQERRAKSAPARAERAKKAANARWGNVRKPDPAHAYEHAKHDAYEDVSIPPSIAPEHCSDEHKQCLDGRKQCSNDAQKCPAIRHKNKISEMEVLLLPTEGAERASAPPPQIPERKQVAGLNPTVSAIRRELLDSSTLAGLATVEFAQRLAAFSDEDGHTGSKSTADVLSAIRAADAKVANEESVGEHMGRGKQVALVVGFVKHQERARKAPTAVVDGKPSAELLGRVKARVEADSDRLLSEAATGKGVRW